MSKHINLLSKCTFIFVCQTCTVELKKKISHLIALTRKYWKVFLLVFNISNNSNMVCIQFRPMYFERVYICSFTNNQSSSTVENIIAPSKTLFRTPGAAINDTPRSHWPTKPINLQWHDHTMHLHELYSNAWLWKNCVRWSPLQCNGVRRRPERIAPGPLDRMVGRCC